MYTAPLTAPPNRLGAQTAGGPGTRPSVPAVPSVPHPPHPEHTAVGTDPTTNENAGIAVAPGWNTICVRNVQSALVYHLMFDGDVGRLTGAQLREHIEGVSGVPIAAQILTVQGRGLAPHATAGDVGLTGGGTVVLEVAGAAAATAAPGAASAPRASAMPGNAVHATPQQTLRPDGQVDSGVRGRPAPLQPVGASVSPTTAMSGAYHGGEMPQRHQLQQQQSPGAATNATAYQADYNVSTTGRPPAPFQQQQPPQVAGGGAQIFYPAGTIPAMMGGHASTAPYAQQQQQQLQASVPSTPLRQQQQQQYGGALQQAAYNAQHLNASTASYAQQQRHSIHPVPYQRFQQSQQLQRGGNASGAGGAYFGGGAHDALEDVVVDVVEIEDAPALAPDCGPGFVGGDAVALPQYRRTAADVEELRLQQQDYVWRLEQVRFETERMNREREMRRQLEDLEYEASLLDRDRVEMERATALERGRLERMQLHNKVELEIQGRFMPPAAGPLGLLSGYGSAAAAGGFSSGAGSYHRY